MPAVAQLISICTRGRKGAGSSPAVGWKRCIPYNKIVNWNQSQDWTLIDMEATCQPSEAESTKAVLNETSRNTDL